MPDEEKDKTPKFDFEVDRAKAEKLSAALTAKYQFLFSTDIGREVLKDILVNFCNFGCFLADEKQRVEWNVGMNILLRLGAYAPDNLDRALGALTMLGSRSVNRDNTK